VGGKKERERNEGKKKGLSARRKGKKKEEGILSLE